MKKIVIPFVCLAILVIACTDTNKKSNASAVNPGELGKAYFLLGEWQNISEEGITTEAWEVKNDSVYAGRSYFITGKDTAFSETISLEQKNNQLFYIPTVKDQNAGQPVEFKLSSSSPTQLTFENPQHDFPSKIIYTMLTKDSLVAEISGNINGKVNMQQFPMKRIK